MSKVMRLAYVHSRALVQVWKPGYPNPIYYIFASDTGFDRDSVRTALRSWAAVDVGEESPSAVEIFHALGTRPESVNEKDDEAS